MTDSDRGVWQARVVAPDGRIITDWMNVEEADLFDTFCVNEPAWHYFGILCFLDMPGYFPQLGACQ